MGFDAQETHDIKTAVSIACGGLVKELSNGAAKSYTITFGVASGHIVISMNCPAAELPDIRAVDGLIRIRGLMDQFELINNGDSFEIVMCKHHNG